MLSHYTMTGVDMGRARNAINEAVHYLACMTVEQKRELRDMLRRQLDKVEIAIYLEEKANGTYPNEL